MFSDFILLVLLFTFQSVLKCNAWINHGLVDIGRMEIFDFNIWCDFSVCLLRTVGAMWTMRVEEMETTDIREVTFRL